MINGAQKLSPREVPVTAQPPLASERLAGVREILRTHATLQDVMDWCRSQGPRRDLADVVVQDEFTHDIVLGLGDDLFAVYDTT